MIKPQAEKEFARDTCCTAGAWQSSVDLGGFAGFIDPREQWGIDTGDGVVASTGRFGRVVAVHAPATVERFAEAFLVLVPCPV